MEAWSIAIVEETRARYNAACDIPAVDVETHFELNQIKDRLHVVEQLAHEAGKP